MPGRQVPQGRKVLWEQHTVMSWKEQSCVEMRKRNRDSGTGGTVHQHLPNGERVGSPHVTPQIPLLLSSSVLWLKIFFCLLNTLCLLKVFF